MILTEEKKEKLRDFFQKRKEVILVYIFGSQAKGIASSLSDVDIAVYLDEKLTRHQRFDLRLFLINRVCSLLGFKKIDLVILNDAPLILQYSILKDGVILYSRDEPKRINIEVKIMSKYFDQKYYQDRHDKILLEQIKKEGIL
ncbi:nucleotidyltransferase domain-containing protein [Candidatus Aerophobetes bacterium]|uniref:Nucleotidyltransferase domain-containing protein n=1 Tax=Aerophobetes bacterium TaxID=2030807 RepID=A0A662DEX2_UNCAE|nr:MAG: nucleotidyltransferase domain-containing protein [Candidatus Aerophobetes bacterium]